jgi:hypothetical protein
VVFSLFHDVKDQFNSGGDAQFLIDAEQIFAHRVLCDAKPLCNFFVRQRQRRSPVCTGMLPVQPHGSSLPGIGAVHGIEDVDAEGGLTTSRGNDPPELQVRCGDSSSSWRYTKYCQLTKSTDEIS